MDPRFKTVVRQVAKAFDLQTAEVEEAMSTEAHVGLINDFLSIAGPLRLVVGLRVPEGADPSGTEGGHLFMTAGDDVRITGKSVLVVRLSEAELTTSNMDSEVMVGVIQGSPIKTLLATLQHVYMPALGQRTSDWAAKLSEESSTEFVGSVGKFVEMLDEAVTSLESGLELAKPEFKYDVENKQPAFNRAAGQPELVASFEGVVESWCSRVEELLAESDQSRAASAEDVGPETELVYWRSRMGKLNSITEQLRGKDCKVVLGVLAASKSRVLKRWRALDNAITDAANEAKDNVKYLATLEKHIEALYHGSPAAMIDCLPALLNNIKMMLTIARYYNTTERMTNLFRKITNQIIVRCTTYLNEPGKLWEQSPPQLIERLKQCIAVDEAYQDQYAITRDALQAQPTGKQFELNENVIFGKLEVFCRRLEKLADMFSTVEQFSNLSRHNVEGMEGLLANFSAVLSDFKRKPYDLLDYHRSHFDRDYLEFNANIQELEAALQSFINQSFESINSTDHALTLLKQFQNILQRESLKDDLDSKLLVIFHNYGLDLETVQLLYEKQKACPPVVRLAPPVAGNIMWARQLMRRIEEPMLKFQANQNLMTTKESKKIVKTYNRIARTIIEFETLWQIAWTKSIEASKAGLQATLVIRHPSNGKLYVNFDREILLLIRETKCLMRMGVQVPPSARMVVLQEDKFKSFFNKLSFALKQHEEHVKHVVPVTVNLLRPHLEDIQRKIEPGMLTLTWTSMNIDGYMHAMHTGLAALEDLISKSRDLIENRIERNLKAISQLQLVELPDDESFTLDKFVSVQERVVRTQTGIMVAKNQEIEEAVEDLLELIGSFRLDSGPAGVDEYEVNKLRSHYSRLLYRAVLNATKAALKQIKGRVGSRASGGFLSLQMPMFDVSVELTIPNVSMAPTLDDVQMAINRCSRAIISIGKSLLTWATPKDKASGKTVHDTLAQDKEVVKMVLLLTGSIEGAKRQVFDFIGEFTAYDWLWKDNMQAAYEAFKARSPTIEDFENEIRKYVDVEQQIAKISPVQNIGALSLETAPLKNSLRSEAAAWKAQYAQNLHAQATEKLEGVMQWMRATNSSLKREVKDLDDVRSTVNILNEVRARESMVDDYLGPVEDMYNLLSAYEVRLDKEEIDLVSDLRYSWRKTLQVSNEMNAQMADLQIGLKRDLVRNVKDLVADVAKFRIDFDANGPMVPGVNATDATERLRKYQRLYASLEHKYLGYKAGEELFGLPTTILPDLDRSERELKLLDRLYSLYTTVINSVSEFNEMPWHEVSREMDAMTATISDFQAQCIRMPKELRHWEAYIELKKTVDDFLQSLPLVQMLAHTSMRSRHWQQLMSLTNKHLAVGSDSFKLIHLLEADLLEVREDVEDIANSAVRELAIEDKLASISDEWTDEQLAFAQFKSRGPIALKGVETAELMEKLEETMMNLGSMAASRYITPFRAEVEVWVNKFSTVSEQLEIWIQVQGMWMYLEAVFTSGDIAKQLPQESKRFQNIDKNWEKVMTKAFETRNVVQYCYGNDHLQDVLPHLLEQLEICQKALSGYLDQKRAAFPRFYFVSDPILLEVLSQGSNPQAIQPHLQSVFAGIEEISFDMKASAGDKWYITQAISDSGELIDLSTTVVVEGNIEEWLDRLLKEMQATINNVVRSASLDCEALPLTEFTHKYQAQVALLGIQFMWTLDCEDSLYRAKTEKGIMAVTAKKNLHRLNELVAINLKSDSELNAFGVWTRTKVETMITVDVHQRDCYDDLVHKKVREPDHFDWQKQARFYWMHDAERAQICVADVPFWYCNEYLGVKERLVITPLTDRCYVTLSQALGMSLGGAPAGPAGTGKTETVKDMGCTLGKYVVVFNCSDQMDYRILGGIIKGLSQSGCWGCFDEFNRIDLEVLSVVAQQVSCVLDAFRQDKPTFQFTDGLVIALNKEVGFFITMNPGYAGRQELPENLKSLFRGVTMMVPDRQIIMKVKLAACGYKESAQLSKKFNVLYRLCEQQLSKQPHYDFGLRNILAVLRTAGASKRAEIEAKEAMLLMRTLRDMNLSKYVAEDVPLFLSLISDLFPGISAEKSKHTVVEKALSDTIPQYDLLPHPAWYEKIIQVHEMALVRHSLMIVGPSGVGKSKIVEILHAALAACPTGDPDLPVMVGQAHRELRMNPKAITAPQMFGSLDVVANEWTEGIFAQLWRKANKDKKNFTWLVLDGPVDAIWIENLNTVMDDNKILTLANNDRIPMLRPNVTLQMEVEDLRNASPATVSRAGVIFISSNDLGWRPLAQGYLKKRRKAEAELLQTFFDKYLDLSLALLRELTPRMAITEVGLVSSLLTMLSALTAEHREPLSAREHMYGHELAEPAETAHLERIFLFALAWSVGGTLESADRTRLDKFLRSTSTILPEAGTTIGSSPNDTIYSFVVNATSGEWEHWAKRVPSWKPPQGNLGAAFGSILVPTIDSTCCQYNIELALSQERPVLLIGGPGTAKTSTVLQVLAKQNPAETTIKSLSFSSATTPLVFQNNVEGCVEKRQGRTFGPPGGKKMFLFVDDFSMPEINKWGDQITLEIVRQLIEFKGLYNLQKPGEWKSIIDIAYLACMLHPGGGKNDVPNRAKRHFHVMNVTLPALASIHQIFGSLTAAAFPANGRVHADVSSTATKLVDMTVQVWEAIKSKLLPTPMKFHYIFNLRDLSRVFQGVFMCDAAGLRGRDDLLQLWTHECERVFSDRLISDEDKAWTSSTISRIVASNVGQEAADTLKATPACFVDFMRTGTEDPETGEEIPAPKVYEAITEIAQLRGRVAEYMAAYNSAEKLHATDLILFEDALMHFVRISRMLRTPRGCALLVGVGGSGRQSLTRLAAYIGGSSVAQIVITKAYGVNNLLEDFKPLYKLAGCAGKSVCFVFGDKEVKDEGFLEYINIFLNTGELPNLFARDEVDAILGECGERFEKEFPREEPTPAKLWAFFLNRVRSNLHLVLCFSPVGAKFRNRARMFPGLINGCTVDWFLPWPQAALEEVAQSQIGKFEIDVEPEVKAQLIKHIAQTHQTVSDSTADYFDRYRRHVYVTPKSYLSFLQDYQTTYAAKHAAVNQLASSIIVGLEKLVQASSDVDLMKIELKEKEKGLDVAKEKSGVLLQEITASTARAEKKKAEVQVVKDALGLEAGAIADVKGGIEKELAAAGPALEEAETALRSIKAQDIGLLKNLKQPPNLIQRLFDCVLVLMRGQLNVVEVCTVKERLVLEHSWKFAVPTMNRSDFLSSLLGFDKDRVNDEDVELLFPYLAAEDFTYDHAKKASGNVAGLCTWIKAMCTYTVIAKVVKPKMAELQVAEGKLAVANKKLARAQAELDACQADLDRMQVDFDEAMASKQRIQQDAEATQKRMDAANRLIGGLAGEKRRWTAQSDAFADEIKRLTGDTALACGFISYVGPFNADFRHLLLTERFTGDCTSKGIPLTPNLNVTKFMVDEGTVGDWALQGLPSDDLSVQNGIMVTRSARWPLLIDPQGQGLSWIRTREEVNQLRTTQLGDKRFRNQLEDAMAFGQPLLLENVEEELDPVLDPVLDKAVQKSGRGFKIVLADKECEYTESFSLFLCSKLANPHFSPELSAQVVCINFTVTMQGLEQQLLGRVVQRERAELEEQRQKLVEEVNANLKLLKGLEDDLLYRLANSTGNLLDDTSLIEVLQNTKTTSAEVQSKLENAEQTDARINAAREEYRPVATRGSLLYFLITDMAAVNSMYQVSLQQFLELFDHAIAHSAKAPLASKRILNIIELLSFHATCYMQRGLFERHKQLWALMLTIKAQVVAGQLGDASVQNLLKGGGALDATSEKPKPVEWLPLGVWLNCIALARACKAFRELPDSIVRNEALWKHWYDSDTPEDQKVPDFHERCSDFDRLLLVRCMREDRMLLSAQTYIANTIGKRYVDSRPLDLKAVEVEAHCRCPIIALLSQGSDPTALVLDLAKKQKQLVRTISLGQGQEPAARKLISTGVTQGSWVMLQNCHLGLKFMAEVETTMLKLDDIDPAFQLWITTEPHPKFPIGLLQMSIKVTNEAPAGVRAGLKSSYAWVNQDMLDAVTQPQWKSMLYALCFMHTIVQERRKFGPLGFNIPYEFNQSDLGACVMFMQSHLHDMDTKKRPVDWECVNYMVCEVQYGGKITDDWDRRLFNTYGQAWLVPAILEPQFKFHEGYQIPQGVEVDAFRKAIETLPLIDNTNLFGLHPNADIAFRTRQTSMVISTMLETQPKAGGGGGSETREEVVLKIVLGLQEKLPVDYKADAVRDSIRKLGGAKPLNICLQQEVDRLQKVISLVRTMLASLKLAIAGTIVMSPDLADALDALFMTRVPPAWTAVSQLEAPSMGVWFTNVLMRAEQLTAWLANGRPNAFWLTGFFNPQGFLTANRQEVCRGHAKANWALDDVINHTEVLKMESEEVKRPPEEGVYLRGLFLDGCRWDKAGNKLADSAPKVLYAPLPVLYVTGVLASDKKGDAGFSFTAPCYKSPKRTDPNFIFAVDLRTEEPPAKWVLRGVCLLTMKD